MAAVDDTLKEVSRALNVDPIWIYNLIKFESSWKPDAKNIISGARGLIQFTNSTARKLGYSSANDLYNKNRDSIKQLKGPVFKYLKTFAPFRTKQSLYMAVFLPIARNWPVIKAIPFEYQVINPGIRTVGDYIRHVDGGKKLPLITVSILTLFVSSGIFLIARKHHYKQRS